MFLPVVVPLAGGAYVSAKFLATQAKESFLEQGRKAPEEVVTEAEDAGAPDQPPPAAPGLPPLDTPVVAQDEATLNRKFALLTALGYLVGADYRRRGRSSCRWLCSACRCWWGTAGPLVTGHFFATSLFATLIHDSSKLLNKTEQRTGAVVVAFNNKTWVPNDVAGRAARHLRRSPA